MSDSRFKIVSAPALLPANDMVTGTTEGPFIDTGRDVQFTDRGRLYLAVSTIEEMAREAGIAVGDVAEAYSKGYAEGSRDVVKEAINDRIGALVDSLGTLLRVLQRFGDDDLVADADVPADDADAEGNAGPDGEPAGSEGRAGVSSDRGDERFRL